jgi:hypothetical protein
MNSQDQTTRHDSPNHNASTGIAPSAVPLAVRLGGCYRKISSLAAYGDRFKRYEGIHGAIIDTCATLEMAVEAMAAEEYSTEEIQAFVDREIATAKLAAQRSHFGVMQIRLIDGTLALILLFLGGIVYRYPTAIQDLLGAIRAM